MQQWVCLKPVPSAPPVPESSEVKAILLPHPKTGVKCRYFLQDQNTTLLEAQRIQTDQRSWFIGDSVQQDGHMYVLTPIHPNFVLLSYLEKNRRKTGSSEGVFVGLDQILFDPDIPHLQQLSNLTLLSELRHICDVKTHGDTTLYRLNDDKLIEWLSARVVRVAEAMKVARANDIPTAVLIENAAHLVADYLPEPWASRLLSRHTNSKPSEPTSDGAMETSSTPVTDTIQPTFETQTKTRGTKTKQTKTPTKEAAMEEKVEEGETRSTKRRKSAAAATTPTKKEEVAAKGTKNISTFFSPKAAAK